MKSINFLQAILISTIFLSCCGSNRILSKSELNNKFGSNYNYEWNSSRDFLLAVNNNSLKKSSAYSFEFFIYSLDEDSIIFKEVYPGGTAGWINSHQVQVNIVPGNVSGDEKEEDFKFIYDIKLNKKIK